MERNRKILSFAVPLAIMGHLVGFAALHGMKLDVHTSNKAYMANQTSLDLSREEMDTSKKELIERNEQLAEVFLELAQAPKEESSLLAELPHFTEQMEVFTFEGSSEESYLDTFEMGASADSMEMHEELGAAAQLCLGDIPVLNFDKDEPLLTLPSDSLQLICTDAGDASKNLYRAEIAAWGELIEENSDPSFEAPCMKIGTLEAESMEGNSLKDFSGLIDKGIIDPYENSMKEVMVGLSNEGSYELIACADIRGQAGSQTGIYPTDRIGALSNQIVGHVARSDDFDVDVAYASRRDGQGYLFRITLLSKDEMVFSRIRKNVTFLIDKSHSISKGRYDATRQALIRVLGELSEEDTFNIIFFDNAIASFNSGLLPCTRQNIDSAKQFIARQTYGGFFASTDLYASLDSIVPKSVDDSELNVAILISDGDTNLNKLRQRTAIKEWTENNNGKVALYSLASGKENNFPLLNLLSVFNKGSLYTSNGNDDIFLTMSKILKDIETPIGKDIVATAISKDERMSLALSPIKARPANLFEKRPFVLYGTANTLGEFYLFFQGKFYDKRINIKRAIGFSQARELPAGELERIWSLQQAYAHYERYINDGMDSHIKKAKALLEPFDIQAAF